MVGIKLGGDMNTFNVIVGIITILTFIILCIDTLPKWYEKCFGTYHIFYDYNNNKFNIHIRFHKIFVISKIYCIANPNIFFNDFHPYNGLFKHKTYGQIGSYHHIQIEKRELETLINNNKISIENNKIDFRIILLSDDGKITEKTLYFQL